MTAADWGAHDLKKSTATRDWCCKEGAEALKARIEEFWLERGHAVQIILQETGFNPAMRSVRFDVRSDMVSGFPQKRKTRA